MQIEQEWKEEVLVLIARKLAISSDLQLYLHNIKAKNSYEKKNTENTGKLILRVEGSAKTKLFFNFNSKNHKTYIYLKFSEKIGIENLYIERED